jgi:2-keto-myo-inositol isomerase
MTKLGFNGATTMKASLEEDIQNAGAAGYDGVELWGEKLDRYLASHPPATLRALLEAARIEPLSINSIEDATFSPDRAVVLERCRSWSRLCREIGCPCVVVVPGVAPSGMTTRAVIEQSALELRELADIAAPDGVRLAFEMIGGQGRSISELRAAREAVRAVERPNVGLVIDTFHATVGGTQVSDLVTLEAELLEIVHINDAEDRPLPELRDSHRLFPGDGTLPLTALLAAVAGRARVFSVEIFRPEYWEMDPAVVARTAFEKSRAVLASAGISVGRG